MPKAFPEEFRRVVVAVALKHQAPMSQIAKDAGLSRESLYKALSADGNPEFGTILKVMKALGLRLSVGAAPTR